MEKNKLYQVRFGGTGGQGVIKASSILGDALAIEGYNVLQTQSHGIEVRGGASCGEVLYSLSEVNKLNVTTSDILLALCPAAITTYAGKTNPGSMIIYDSHTITEPVCCDGRAVYCAPFTEIARQELGGTRNVNLISLGFVCALSKAVSKDSLYEALATQLPKGLENNWKAVLRGYEEAEKQGLI